MSHSRIIVMVGLFSLLAAHTIAAEPPHDPLNFTVLRNGEVVGSHSISFQPSGEEMDVIIDTNIVVKIAIVPVYRFEHHGQEIWQHDHLLSLTSKTNDDGAHHTLKVSDVAGQLDINGDGQSSQMADSSIPASLWNRATIDQSVLLNTLTGKAMTIQVANLGEDVVVVHGQQRPASHYAVTGDLARELWYDQSGSLVQVRFKATDNSDIQYVLR